MFCGPENDILHGKSSPPCGSSECCLFAVIHTWITPPLSIKEEDTREMVRGKCPTTPFLRWTTATEYRSWGLLISFSQSKVSPTSGSHLSLYTWYPRTTYSISFVKRKGDAILIPKPFYLLSALLITAPSGREGIFSSSSGCTPWGRYLFFGGALIRTFTVSVHFNPPVWNKFYPASQTIHGIPSFWLSTNCEHHVTWTQELTFNTFKPCSSKTYSTA